VAEAVDVDEVVVAVVEEVEEDVAEEDVLLKPTEHLTKNNRKPQQWKAPVVEVVVVEEDVDEAVVDSRVLLVHQNNKSNRCLLLKVVVVEEVVEDVEDSLDQAEHPNNKIKLVPLLKVVVEEDVVEVVEDVEEEGEVEDKHLLASVEAEVESRDHPLLNKHVRRPTRLHLSCLYTNQ